RCDGVDNDCNGEIDEIIFIDESALSDVTTGVQLNGSSFLDEFGNIVLTLNTPNTAGSVLYQDTVPGDTWAATFEIYSGNPLQNSQGGDGMAFVFYDASKTDATFVGTSGGYLGADNPGVVGYAVEFDTYDNGTALGDPDGNHIAIVATDERPLRTLAAASSRDGVPLLDDSETIHRVQVVMREGTVEVSINDVTLLTHTIAGYNLSSLRMGFTAGTGSIVNFHVVASAKVECVP
ncbi:MAG: L-type lectin-domain containing protein, partial [Myxococcota bacterium]